MERRRTARAKRRRKEEEALRRFISSFEERYARLGARFVIHRQEKGIGRYGGGKKEDMKALEDVDAVASAP